MKKNHVNRFRAFAFLGVLALAFAASSVKAQSASGSAYIPRWTYYTSDYSYYRTRLYITNITGSDVDVTIYLYNETNDEGQPSLWSDNDVMSGEHYVSYDEDPAVGSVAVTIAPYEQFLLELRSPYNISTIDGFGRISWTQSGENLQGTALLVAGKVTEAFAQSGRLYRSAEALFINGGKPF